MSFDRSPRWISPARTFPALFILWIVMLVCLLPLSANAEAMAASGSTRLTIRLDQSAVDAIIKWRKEHGLPVPASASGSSREVPPAPPATEAEETLRRALPAVRAGLLRSLHPQTADRILRHLQQDALLLFDGRAQHSGREGLAWFSNQTSGGRLTVHSF